MYDFLRVACAVTKVKVADAKFNTEEIIKKITEADKKDVDIVLFPELCITGYTCGDLFFQNQLTDSAKEGLSEILSVSKKVDTTIIVGCPLVVENSVYNCGVVVKMGRIYGIGVKTYIPNYCEYYEKRWFASSNDLKTDHISSLELGISEEYSIPIGKNLLFNLGKEATFAIEICEDLWAPIPPSSYHALKGAELIFNLSASNDTISKHSYRKNMVSQQSAGTLTGYVYTSAGREESTTDLIFSGHSIICENGNLIGENEKNIDSDYLLIKDIDLGKIRADRKKNTTFKDCSKNNNNEDYQKIYMESEPSKADGTKSIVNKMPFVPSNKKDRLLRCKDIFEMQTNALVKRLEITGLKPVIGVSGGLDSTLALLVCVEAMKKLCRDTKDVVGITMPCFGTTSRTYENSIKLMDTLGITRKEINIKNACLNHFHDIDHDENVLDLTYENSQARERTQVLMDYAGKIGGIVVGTGDLSELALGWCTYNADHMSMYGVNAGVPKTLVRWMVESVVEFRIFPESTDVLKDICNTPISPELLPPDNSGKISQKTESIIGPYELHDFFLYYVVRYGFSPKKIYNLAISAFNTVDGDTILKWLKNFYKRFFSQQFKRSCLPDGVKIGSICLSPRGDWRMPSDACSKIWLDELENIEHREK